MIRHPLRAGLAVAAATLVVDQATKLAVLAHFADEIRPPVQLLPCLRIGYIANHGVSFGLFNGGGVWQPAVFSVVAIAIVAGLVHVLRSARSWINVAGIGLIIGGAIGNLADRVRLGSVVDFVDFYIGTWHWYVFNIADAAICVGVGLMLLDSLLTRPESPKA
jgi:signal peptidase II